ncbi:MAG TPA: hypothetical protein VGE76_20050, partial [Opitutaceae bacterium]
ITTASSRTDLDKERFAVFTTGFTTAGDALGAGRVFQTPVFTTATPCYRRIPYHLRGAKKLFTKQGTRQ